MIYRGPGFLAVACFGSSPTLYPPPLSHLQAVSLSQSSCELTDGREGGKGGRGAKYSLLCPTLHTFGSVYSSVAFYVTIESGKLSEKCNGNLKEEEIHSKISEFAGEGL
jgi:hypothetical protein